MAVIRVINKFHNQDFIVIPNGKITLTKFKRYVKRACNQKDCCCETKVYMKTNDAKEADLADHGSFRDITEYWKLIDPIDLQLRDAGYGIKL